MLKLPEELIKQIITKSNTIIDFYNISTTSLYFYKIIKGTEHYKKLNKYKNNTKYMKLILSELCEKDNVIFPMIYNYYTDSGIIQDNEIQNIILKSCRNGCIENIKHLLKYNNPLDDLIKIRMLVLSCYGKNIKLVKKMLDWIDCDIPNCARVDMIVFAHYSSSVEVVKYLLKLSLIPKVLFSPPISGDLFGFILEFDMIDLAKDFCCDNREFVKDKIESILRKCAEFNSSNIFDFFMNGFYIKDIWIEENLMVAVVNNSYDIILYILTYEIIELKLELCRKIFSFLCEQKDINLAKLIINIYIDNHSNIDNDLVQTLDYIFIFGCLNDWLDLANFIYRTTIKRYSLRINTYNYIRYIAKENLEKIRKCEQFIVADLV